MNDNKTMKVTDNFMTILLLCFSMYYSLYIYIYSIQKLFEYMCLLNKWPAPSHSHMHAPPFVSMRGD